MKPKRSKSWDINYHWIEYRTQMGHLNPYWERGIHNRAGYFTKHNPLSYHKKMRYKYLQKVHLTTNKLLHAKQCEKIC